MNVNKDVVDLSHSQLDAELDISKVHYDDGMVATLDQPFEYHENMKNQESQNSSKTEEGELITYL